ncbi:epiplakin-like [Rhineura floridana]|uniref:epiplakin-like n=1 Tax=Rhineura floridana TaxID=261503 RepID=UPI002AC889F6|nr:epiplakin-like [Rhineura floridana]
MPQDKQFAKRDTEEVPIVQVREEPRWPFPSAVDLREDHVIAGILKEPGQERLSIRQAMHRGLLTHGMGLALLEHQAVSGYIVDLANNRLLSVRDAKNAGLVDREHFNTLLLAEKAVTGYTDPFSGNKISIFQAIKKGLLIKDHGIRLLEAQVATGGLIHPMHSHRLPVEVAYKWGYLDSEIFHLISNPTNHTKRCFDPNAHENLTYLQLLPRCILDPVSGLLMFQVMDKGSVHLDENMRKCLKSATIKVHLGLFQGEEVSIWDLLFSRYVPRHKRQELLRQYKAGTITLQEIAQILTTIITDVETRSNPSYLKKLRPTQEMALPETERWKHAPEQEETDKALKSRMVKVPAGEFRGRKVSVWELLHSKYLPKEKRKEILKQYRAGILTVDQMETVVTAIVAKIEEEKARELGHMTGTGPEERDRSDHQEAQLRQSLRLIRVPVASGEFKGQNVPVLDLLYSNYFTQDKRRELMELYRTGALSPEQMTLAVSKTLQKAEASRKKFSVRVKSRSKEASKEVKVADPSPSKHADDALKAELVTLSTGEFQGQQLSVWDLLFSHYLTRDKREELLGKYREGKFSVQELSSMLTILASLHDLFYSLEQTQTMTSSCSSAQDTPGPLTTSKEEEEEEEEDDDGDDGDDGQDEKDEVLKSRMVEVPIGEFHGQKVSVWELLHSKYFPEKKGKEILQMYRIGILTADQMETVVTAVVTKLGEDKSRGGQQVNITSPDAGASNETGRACFPKDRTMETLTFEFPVGEFQGRQVSMWDLLFSTYVSEAKRQELLMRFITGAMSSQELVTILTALIIEEHKRRSTTSILHLFSLLYPETCYMMFGPSQAQTASMPNLLHAQEEEAHKAGRVTFSEITVTTTVIHGPEQKQEQPAAGQPAAGGRFWN